MSKKISVLDSQTPPNLVGTLTPIEKDLCVFGAFFRMISEKYYIVRDFFEALTPASSRHCVPDYCCTYKRKTSGVLYTDSSGVYLRVKESSNAASRTAGGKYYQSDAEPGTLNP
ncbi:hypothetical protein WMY93_015444 [Mugilogobius chulae]|uniref:Uncharacterized protein n=1 Tax=Mugilogobius chulae TaxID=88201 RepID=A0AAW0NST3_9GOBI